jgi:hypothetical protein
VTTPQPGSFEAAIGDGFQRLAEFGRQLGTLAATNLNALNARLEEARRTMPDTLTVASTITTLADKVAAVERYQPDTYWTIRTDPDAGPAWVIEWHLLTITLRDRSDLELARFIAAERRRARTALRRIVIDAASDAGLRVAPFLYPAPLG